MTEQGFPTYEDFLTRALEVIAAAGGSLGRAEVKDKVVKHAGLSDEQLSVTYPTGRAAGRSIALDRVGWALSSLKLMGALDNSTRGVWSITSRGRELMAQGHEAVITANRTARSEARRRRRSLPTSLADVDEDRDNQDSDELPEQAGDAWQS